MSYDGPRQLTATLKAAPDIRMASNGDHLAFLTFQEPNKRLPASGTVLLRNRPGADKELAALRTMTPGTTLTLQGSWSNKTWTYGHEEKTSWTFNANRLLNYEPTQHKGQQQEQQREHAAAPQSPEASRQNSTNAPRRAPTFGSLISAVKQAWAVTRSAYSAAQLARLAAPTPAGTANHYAEPRPKDYDPVPNRPKPDWPGERAASAARSDDGMESPPPNSRSRDKAATREQTSEPRPPSPAREAQTETPVQRDKERDPSKPREQKTATPKPPTARLSGALHAPPALDPDTGLVSLNVVEGSNWKIVASAVLDPKAMQLTREATAALTRMERGEAIHLTGSWRKSEPGSPAPFAFMAVHAHAAPIDAVYQANNGQAPPAPAIAPKKSAKAKTKGDLGL